MSIKKIHLRKLLRMIYARPPHRVGLIRDDIRAEIAKENGEDPDGGGGDFHGPFWADAKNHVAGISDLTKQTAVRIAANKYRARLYPMLRDGFLEYWDRKRRWRNEPLEFIPHSLKTQYEAEGIGVVKVENTLSVKAGDDFCRIIYPYFAEDPLLPEEGLRVGLWVLSQCVATHSIDDLRILDVLRGNSVGTVDHPFQGDERQLFLRRYEELSEQWRQIREEYR